MALIPTLKLFKWELTRAGVALDKDPMILTGQQAGQ